jgi:FMN phosphatase YigB (HAD superfamily)
MNIGRLRRAIARHHPEVLFLDCFDTVLLRGSESEDERVRRLGVRIAADLSGQGFAVSPTAAAATRTAAARAEYVAAAREGREARHGDILRLQCLALGLPASCADAMLDAEIAQETRDLRPNLPLLSLLREIRIHGIRVVVVSDMYLPASAIRQLLRNAGAAEEIDEVYSSSDHGPTKRGGGLFQVVLAAEGMDPDRCLHAGDCRHGDFEMPLRRGIAAVQLPRPHLALVRAVRRTARRFFGEPLHV